MDKLTTGVVQAGKETIVYTMGHTRLKVQLDAAPQDCSGLVALYDWFSYEKDLTYTEALKLATKLIESVDKPAPSEPVNEIDLPNPWEKQVGGAHYKKGVQPMYRVLANRGFAAFEAVCDTWIDKYTAREKVDKLEDLKKAQHFLELWIYEKTYQSVHGMTSFEYKKKSNG